MMNRESLQKLRKQIVLNSLYTSDYENNMGIPTINCCEFFNGYVDYLSEIIEEEFGEVTDNDFFDKLKEVDTIENLESWYYCFEDNPLAFVVELEEVA